MLDGEVNNIVDLTVQKPIDVFDLTSSAATSSMDIPLKNSPEVGENSNRSIKTPSISWKLGNSSFETTAESASDCGSVLQSTTIISEHVLNQAPSDFD